MDLCFFSFPSFFFFFFFFWSQVFIFIPPKFRPHPCLLRRRNDFRQKKRRSADSPIPSVICVVSQLSEKEKRTGEEDQSALGTSLPGKEDEDRRGRVSRSCLQWRRQHGTSDGSSLRQATWICSRYDWWFFFSCFLVCFWAAPGALFSFPVTI
jgi:hypothetical protein